MKSATAMLGVVVLTFAATAHSDDIAERGRAVMDEHQSAVVTLQLVLKEKFSMPGMPSQDSESTAEATGTVIGADGLTVLSLFKTDPTSLIEALMPAMGGMGEMDMGTEVKEVRFLMKDGSEIPAEVLLRDKDLDMVFVRPIEQQSEPFAFIALDDSASPAVLDHVVSLNRMGKVAGRAYSASVARIESVVQRPRTFYVAENAQNDMAKLGAPAFTLDGNIVGITFLRLIKSSAGGMGGMMGMMGGMQDMLTTIILPAQDILESAAQVPAYE